MDDVAEPIFMRFAHQPHAISKKGDPKLPANYRPIAILPILYKLFSRMLCVRLNDAMISRQSVDQAAYRKGFSTEDHLLCTTLLVEQCNEWNIETWLGLVDFEKAFDTVEHDPLWDALTELGVNQSYINILKMLYGHQEAEVAVGTKSRLFTLERGVKQGDPISSFLFIAVMEVVFRSLKRKWGRLNQRRTGAYFGMVVDDPKDPLTNLRFADDVILVATSRSDVSKMIADLSREAGRYGLNLHMGKTKILTNSCTRRPKSIKCLGQDIQVVSATDAEKYLGRKLSLDRYHDTELANRVASGWACFFKYKCTLCNRRLSLRYRMKLFDACVTPCVLYACGTWTMTAQRDHLLTKTRRRMLRWMMHTTRFPEECWVDYIVRATHRCENLASMSGSSEWVALQREQKWKLAGKAATCSDGRWTNRLLLWRPWHGVCPFRRVGRPARRWADEFVECAGSDWPQAATDRTVWYALTYHSISTP